MRLSNVAQLCSLALVTTLTACAETTSIRRTAFVPGATGPSRLGRPLGQGDVRVAAQANAIRFLPDPQSAIGGTENDPGLLLPAAQAGAIVYAGVSRFVEVRAQAKVAPRAW